MQRSTLADLSQAARHWFPLISFKFCPFFFLNNMLQPYHWLCCVLSIVWEFENISFWLYPFASPFAYPFPFRSKASPAWLGLDQKTGWKLRLRHRKGLSSAPQLIKIWKSAHPMSWYVMMFQKLPQFFWIKRYHLCKRLNFPGWAGPHHGCAARKGGSRHAVVVQSWHGDNCDNFLIRRRMRKYRKPT